VSRNYLLPSMPEGLEELVDLALDLRWSWNHAADKLWRQISPDLWEKTCNPWLILQTVSASRLKKLADDDNFRRLMNVSISEHRQALKSSTWFQKTHAKLFKVAYFSMEYALSEALPIYSGGLGILAGDYLKTASDLGVPVVGVGLLYQQGYFRQVIDVHGDQTETFPYNDPNQLPVTPVRDQDGEWLRVHIDFPGGILSLRCWEVTVGRVKLYLLDSNDPVNAPADRGITGELYVGDQKTRLKQEIILGIGGWRMLEAIGVSPEICHLNEGHPALVVVERARAYMIKNHQPFDVALAATRPGNVFTTHTSVEAGFDIFPKELVTRYLSDYADELGIGIDNFMALGQDGSSNSQAWLNMAYLAFQGSGFVNAVSRSHIETSRKIFQPLFPRWPVAEIPITYITNGIHVPSWDSEYADELWTETCGKRRWLTTLDTVKDEFKTISDEAIWGFRLNQRKQLLSYARECLSHHLASTGAAKELTDQCGQMLDVNVLTAGFARRFTDYKRIDLLLRDPERLEKIINHPERPVQIIIAGKAHPQDEEGKKLVKKWWEFATRQDVRSRVVFLEDYDMRIAEQLVQGVDLWINTPRHPWEACGTSGMKVLVNGGLNVSVLEGWWAEAYNDNVGWAIGDGLRHEADPK